MFLTAYDTSLLRQYRPEDITDKIEQSILRKGAQNVVKQIESSNCYHFILDDGFVPTFNHPIKFRLDPIGKKDDYSMATDVRPYSRVDRMGERVFLNGRVDFENLRVSLNEAWLNGTPAMFRTAINYPAMVFTRWITGVISRHLNLMPVSQVKLSILTSYYFQCLFETDAEDTLTEGQKRTFANTIVQTAYVTSSEAQLAIENLPVCHNLTDFVNLLKTYGESDRYSILTPAIIYALTNRAWFGTHAGELVASALEFPPDFYTLVYAACGLKGYNRTSIGEIVKSGKSSANEAHFIKTVKYIQKTGME